MPLPTRRNITARALMTGVSRNINALAWRLGIIDVDEFVVQQ